MAIYEGVTTVNLVAGEDLRDSKNLLLHINSEGKVIKTTAVSDIAIGILAENPSSSEDTTGFGVPVVMLGGIIKAMAGHTISAGHFVFPSGSVPGHTNSSATLAAGNFSVGIALEYAVDGDVFNAVSHTLLG